MAVLQVNSGLSHLSVFSSSTCSRREACEDKCDTVTVFYGMDVLPCHPTNSVGRHENSKTQSPTGGFLLGENNMAYNQADLVPFAIQSMK